MKYSYLSFLLELRALQGVQNDRNGRIMVDASWFQMSQTLTRRVTTPKGLAADDALKTDSVLTSVSSLATY